MIFSFRVKSPSKKFPCSNKGNILHSCATILPSVIFSTPEIILSNVDFPAPFFPIKP